MKKLLLVVILVLTGIRVSPTLASTECAENKESVLLSIEKSSCISGVFKATEDDWTGMLSLWSDCTFKFVEREGRNIDSTEGTYTVDGDVTPGSVATITFYVNGRNYGQATIAWPLEEGLQVWMNGYTFTKI